MKYEKKTINGIPNEQSEDLFSLLAEMEVPSDVKKVQS
jgi:hypothetical protein